MNDRTILHCDCNAFFASVECLLNPKLLTVPMAVAGDSDSRRGIILAKNEIAKRYNVQTAETIAKAKTKCPDLVLVPPRHDIYEEYSEAVNSIYLEYTDLAERFGIDETWLDVTGSYGLFGDGKTIADALRERIKKEIGITISVGVSFNKVFAKFGSDYKKPDATTVITRENYKEIIYPVPVSELLLVGKKTAEILKKMYIFTIGDLANADLTLLKRKFGKLGETLYVYATGLDNEPVKSAYCDENIKSVGKGRTFPYDITHADDIKKEIYTLSDNVARRLRKNRKKCNCVQVQMKDSNFKITSKQTFFNSPSHTAFDIAECALKLFFELNISGEPVRSLTVTAHNLIDEDSMEQLSFLEADDDKKEKIECTVDRLKDIYGDSIIKRGSNLK